MEKNFWTKEIEKGYKSLCASLESYHVFTNLNGLWILYFEVYKDLVM